MKVDENKPLVSILVPNYNYACYLEQCFESILSQTYSNIEVIFKDNDSTDNSYEIAIKYQKIFKERGIYMFVSQNRRNIGSAGNTAKCYHESEGEFVIYLSSDDAMRPTCIEKAVNIMIEHQNVGMVMVHRTEMDERGNLKDTVPFYSKNCIIPKESQASVFMMAGIAIPSQVLMRKSVLAQVYGHRLLIFQVASDWLENFMMSMYADVAYLKESLCLYRVHSGNETTGSERNLVGIFEHYQLINSFVWISKSFGMVKPGTRYDEAVKKLAKMCLRYAIKMYKNKENLIAEKYLFLAPVFDREIRNDIIYQKLMFLVDITGKELEENLERITLEFSSQREISYEPPEDAIELKL